MLLGYKRNKLCENMIIFFELLSSQYAISIHTVGDFFLFGTVGDLECNSSLRGLIYNILESAINIYVRTIKG